MIEQNCRITCRITCQAGLRGRPQDCPRTWLLPPVVQGVCAKIWCEKCGQDDVLIRWHGAGAYHRSRTVQPCFGDYGRDRGKPAEEHLHYHCQTCQFDWTGPLTPAEASHD